MADKLRQVPYDIRQCRLIISRSVAPVLVAQQPGAVIILWAPFWAFWCGVVGGAVAKCAWRSAILIALRIFCALPRVNLCRICRGAHCISRAFQSLRVSCSSSGIWPAARAMGPGLTAGVWSVTALCLKTPSSDPVFAVHLISGIWVRGFCLLVSAVRA